MKRLQKNQIYDVRIKKNKMASKINLKEASTVLLTIPYDKGWHIYVDGKKVKYKKLADTFIGLDLSKGNHTIKMIFYPKGLWNGVITSLICVTVLIIFWKRRKV